MPRIPSLFGDSFIDFIHPSGFFGPHFGMMVNDMLSSRMAMPVMRPTYFSAPSINVDNVTINKDKFQVVLDVQQFKPNEISVKVTGNNEITVEGKHEEQRDGHGFITRHFIRRYVLPDGHNIKKVVSQLSSDGILCICAPKMESVITEEREIPITETGSPAAKLEN